MILPGNVVFICARTLGQGGTTLTYIVTLAQYYDTDRNRCSAKFLGAPTWLYCLFLVLFLLTEIAFHSVSAVFLAVPLSRGAKNICFE